MFKKFFDRVPTLEEALPDLVSERDLKARIQAKAAHLKTEIAALRNSIKSGVGDAGRNARVETILSGTEPPKPTADMKRLEEMLERLADLNAAVDAQATKINSLERQASNIICEKMRGEHDRLAGILCSKLIDAYHAHVAYLALQDALTDKGVRTTPLQPLTSKILEFPRDKCSGLAYLLRDAREHGFIDAKQIPEAIR